MIQKQIKKGDRLFFESLEDLQEFSKNQKDQQGLKVELKKILVVTKK
ncbi:hypothetical protein T190115A13A_60202 [Tenacibaculum sp. 190524A02b]|uniref:Uncharacterized protein n=1 Tax=Tenacibaculum vairaonense TaxID=3137860 RepID=A0ABM9PQZ2_9FLAO